MIMADDHDTDSIYRQSLEPGETHGNWKKNKSTCISSVQHECDAAALYFEIQKKEEVEKTTFLYLAPHRASRAGYSHHILLSNTCRFSLADFSKSQLGFRRNINPPPSAGHQQGLYKPGKSSCDTCSAICKTQRLINTSLEA